MVDDVVVPYWVGAIIDLISEARERFLLEVVVINRPALARPAPKSSSSCKVSTLYSIYSRLDEKRASKTLTALPYISRDIRSRISGVPIVELSVEHASRGARVRPRDLSVLRDRGVDILLDISGFGVIEELVASAKYGVWTCRYGDTEKRRGGPEGFWEVFCREPVTAVSLEVQADPGTSPRILDRVYVRTDPTSPSRNRSNMTVASVSLFENAANRVFRQQPSRSMFHEFLAGCPRPSERRVGAPSTFQMLSFLARNLVELSRRRLVGKNMREQWSFGLVERAPLELTSDDLLRVRWYQPDEAGFIADPFPVKRNGTTLVFVEEYLEQRGRGQISVIRYDDVNGRFSRPTPVLQADFHLSFPFVFEHGKKLYMVPEQAESGEIALYRCVDFPLRWEKVRSLVENFPGMDSVVYRFRDRWWLFTAKGDSVNTDNNLHLFSAEDLFAEFAPHPKNPVRTGLYASRMAGAIFPADDGRLIRPAQNCVQRYGGSVVFQEIVTLTETDYRERTVRELAPNQKAVFGRAFHTINSVGGTTVVDGARLVGRS